MDIPFAIKLINLKFYFSDSKTMLASDKPMLSVPQWEVLQGEKVFIHGASGAGKTTLLNLLMGIFLPKSGQINLFGQQLEQMTPRQRDRFRAQNIGCIFQQFNLLPYLNAQENIDLAKRFSGTRLKSPSAPLGTDSPAQTAQQLLSRLGLSTEEWLRPVNSLSVGQQQRVAIARALIHRPPLIIADEPTSALDPANTQAFMDLLLEMAAEYGSSLVFVSHERSLAKGFDRVEIFHQGNFKEAEA